MDPLLQLFLGVFGGLEPQDLITGPEDSLGTQVWVYDQSGNRVYELTDPANQNQNGPLVGAGFGNPANKYSWSSAIYGGDLYIGTFNTYFDYKGGIAAYLRINQQGKVGVGPGSNLFSILTDNEFFPTVLETQGGEIWKYDSGTSVVDASGGTWTKVYDAATVPQLGPDVAGFRSMVAYDGKLLAASSSSLIFDLLSINQDQPTTISVYNGTSWSVLTGGPFGDSNNSSIRTMKEVNGKLLIGTENAKDGAQLWRLQFSGDLPIWTRLKDLPAYTFTDISGQDLTDLYGKGAIDPASTGDILDLSGFAGLQGKFLVGTWQPYGLYMGDVNNPSAEYVPIILPENLLVLDPSPIDNGVMRLEAYNGYVYVGSVNYSSGTSLFRISIESLKAIDTIPEASISLQQGQSALIASSGWEVLTTNGFRSIQNNIIDDELVEPFVRGSGVNDPSGNGISVYSWTMKVVNNKLYVGDFSGEAGVARLYEITDTGIAGDASGNFSSYLNPFKDGSDNTVTIRLVDDTFGPEAYGLRTMQVVGSAPNQSLIVGDADPFDSEIGLLNRFLDDPTRQVKLITRRGTGGESDDVLFGAMNSVTINGAAGEDIIFASMYDDRINGGADQDFLVGNRGKDLMYGGAQSDLMWGDLISFGSNSLAEGLLIQLQALLIQAVSPQMAQQLLNSNTSVDELLSTVQSTQSSNSAFSEVLSQLSILDPGGLTWGEELQSSLLMLGNPFIEFGSFDDTMYGDAGEDLMFGGLGDDKMYGGADRDIIVGQQGNDILWGNDGDDQLEGGRDADKYYGGLGNDIYDLRIQSADPNGDPILVTDNSSDRIYFTMSNFAANPAQEKVFGFEQGLDKVYIVAKTNISISGNVATLTYLQKGAIQVSTIDLTNDEGFVWSKSDFVFI